MSDIRFGILGCANIAWRMMIPAIKSMGGMELVAIASRTKEKADLYVQEFGGVALDSYDELINRDDIDAIYMPLPTGMHHEWGMKVLEAGKHLISEKSLGSTKAEVDDLLETARTKGLCVHENFMFLYHSQQQWVKDQIEAGVVGKVHCVRSSFGFPPFPDKKNIRYQKELGGGSLLDAGAYTLKAAQMILGEGLQVKAASLTNDSDKGVDIFGGAFLTGNNGVIAEVAFGFDNFYQCNYEVWGSEGKLTVTRAFTAGPGFKPSVIIERQGEHKEHVLEPDDHFGNSLGEFRDTIESGNTDRHFSAMADQARLIANVFTQSYE